jgi:hypothetical protein
MPNISSALSTADHHSLLENTNSFEGTLENATEYATAILLDNSTTFKKLDAQQKVILEHKAKIMNPLSQTDLKPFCTSRTAQQTKCHDSNRRQPRPWLLPLLQKEIVQP